MGRMWVCAMSLASVLFLGAWEAQHEIRPIAAGLWYPADPKELRTSVEKYISKADAVPLDGPVRACIVPHAPYDTSGAIAGAAFRQLEPNQYDRVIVLAPAHFSTFRGCSIPSAQTWETPLGDVALDGPAIRALGRSTLIEVRSLRYKQDSERTQVHERESTIEVILPFLQVRLKAFTLVPILVGDFLDYRKQTDENALEAVARAIRPLVDERTLIVVSSDFTHFGNNFSYRPFREQILERIEALDKQAFDLIMKRDYRGYRAYLDQTKNTICGKDAIALLLKLLPRSTDARLLEYDVSARKTGDTRSSISFASIVFAEIRRTPAEGSPPPANQEGNPHGHQ